MAVTAEQLGRELRAFDGRRKIVQALRRALTREARPLVKRIRESAENTLPSTGGLDKWVARARVGVRISYGSRSSGIRLRAGRRSLTDRSDLAGIDRGKVRAPSWGHRTAASWHTVAVPAGWWSTPTEQHGDAFAAAADREVDQVLTEIRRG